MEKGRKHGNRDNVKKRDRSVRRRTDEALDYYLFHAYVGCILYYLLTIRIL